MQIFHTSLLPTFGDVNTKTDPEISKPEVGLEVAGIETVEFQLFPDAAAGDPVLLPNSQPQNTALTEFTASESVETAEPKDNLQGTDTADEAMQVSEPPQGEHTRITLHSSAHILDDAPKTFLERQFRPQPIAELMFQGGIETIEPQIAKTPQPDMQISGRDVNSEHPIQIPKKLTSSQLEQTTQKLPVINNDKQSPTLSLDDDAKPSALTNTATPVPQPINRIPEAPMIPLVVAPSSRVIDPQIDRLTGQDEFRFSPEFSSGLDVSTHREAGSSVVNTRAPQELPRLISSQLVDIARTNPDKPVELTLNPEELGKLRMTFKTDASSMNIVVQVERPETLELMRRHIDQLAQDMGELGYSSVQFSFQQQGGDGADAQGNHSGNGTVLHESETPPPPTVHDSIPMKVTVRDGIDIRL